MPTLIANNLPIYYEQTGSGADVILLHGWGVDLRVFDQLVPKLNAKLTLIDLPGFGKSPAPTSVYSVSDYVAVVEQLITKLGLTDLTLLGHSFGGRISIKLASHPNRLRKLVLIDAAGMPSTEGRLTEKLAKTGKKLFSFPGLKSLSEPAQKTLYKLVGSKDYQASGQLQETFKMIVKEDLRPYANQILAPTLIIWGENDTETPLEQGQELHKLIQKSELKIIKGATHFPFISHLDECAKLITEFIDDAN